jgi:4-amino-4-deoxy-L-arabinose transferase-like glycosyltransferase
MRKAQCMMPPELSRTAGPNSGSGLGGSWLAVVALAIFVSFSFQGSRGLYESTEGRYAECGLEMVKSGNYIEPTLSGRPHWTKPPMTYWVIAAGIELFGANEWGARLFNSVAFCLTVLAVAMIGRTLWDERTAIAAGLVYLSSPYTVLGAASLSTDTLLALWTTLAALCYVRVTTSAQGDTKRYLWGYGMWLSAGLGFLTKGPAVFIPLAALVVYHLIARRPFRELYPPGVVIFAAVGLSWTLLMASRHEGLLSYWVGEEMLKRFSSDTFHRNQRWYSPFEIYIPVVTIGLGPWLFFPARLFLRDRLYKVRRLTGLLSQSRTALLVLLWFALPLAVFMIAKTRLWLYVLPLYAPLCLASARAYIRTAGDRGLRRALIIAAATAIVLVGMKGIAANYPYKNDMKPVYELVRSQGPGPVHVAAVEEERLYGLQFYLGGMLERLSVSGEKPWADRSLNDALISIAGENTHERHVFVIRKDKLALIEGPLKHAGLSYRSAASGRWYVISVGPADGLPQTRGNLS